MTADEAAGVSASEGMARAAGERPGASYANFLVSNSRVIFPLFDARHDEAVAQILRDLFPGREVVGVDGR